MTSQIQALGVVERKSVHSEELVHTARMLDWRSRFPPQRWPRHQRSFASMEQVQKIQVFSSYDQTIGLRIFYADGSDTLGRALAEYNEDDIEEIVIPVNHMIRNVRWECNSARFVRKFFFDVGAANAADTTNTKIGDGKVQSILTSIPWSY